MGACFFGGGGNRDSAIGIRTTQRTAVYRPQLTAHLDGRMCFFDNGGIRDSAIGMRTTQRTAVYHPRLIAACPPGREPKASPGPGAKRESGKGSPQISQMTQIGNERGAHLGERTGRSLRAEACQGDLQSKSPGCPSVVAGGFGPRVLVPKSLSSLRNSALGIASLILGSRR